MDQIWYSISRRAPTQPKESSVIINHKRTKESQCGFYVSQRLSSSFQLWIKIRSLLAFKYSVTSVSVRMMANICSCLLALFVLCCAVAAGKIFLTLISNPEQCCFSFLYFLFLFFIQCCLNPHYAEIHTSSDFNVQTLIFISELLLLSCEYRKRVSREAQILFHIHITSLLAVSAQTSLLNVFSLYSVLYSLCGNNLTPVSYPGCFGENVCPPWNWPKSCRLLLW